MVAIAAISLLVGGIGNMNIVLATVLERSNYGGDVYRALQDGALAYLTKDASDDELVEAILP